MSKVINYEFKRGDTKVLNKFRPTDANGEPLTLTPLDQIYFTMKDTSQVAVIKKKIGSGITLGDDNE